MLHQLGIPLQVKHFTFVHPLQDVARCSFHVMYTEEHVINEATYSILAISSPCAKFNLTDWKIKDTFAR